MITISLPRPILEGMFDECERFLEEETGGRLLGFWTWQRTNLHIDVKCVLPAGPNARRSRVSQPATFAFVAALAKVAAA